MPEQTLFLFPDTNFFIQCYPPSQLDWSDWKEFTEVNLIVCRTVQREIDNQKNLRNDRVGRKARATSSIFGTIIDGVEEYMLVRESTPVVKLFLEGPGLPSPEPQGPPRL